MTDPHYSNPRLAAVYDPLDPDRSDLDVYAAMVVEFGADSVLDMGCGTGTFACLLAQRGVTVIGVDPAAASLEVARRKPGADRVRWILGDAGAVLGAQVDLAFMTANVAQVFLTDDDWSATLSAAFAALRPGGRLVFETRDPARRAWLNWNRAETYFQADIPDIGRVETWTDVMGFDGQLLTFRSTFVFGADGAVLTSDSTLRFRSRLELERTVVAAGFELQGVRDAPDRPGREFVFVVRRPAPSVSGN